MLASCKALYRVEGPFMSYYDKMQDGMKSSGFDSNISKQHV